MAPVFEAWARAYPGDALGGIGRGLAMIGRGEAREGYRLIEDTERTARTLGEQARDVLSTLKRDLQAMTD